MKWKDHLVISMVALAGGCSAPDDSHVFTLYSNHSKDLAFRLHVATFDASPKEGVGANEAWTKAFAQDNLLDCDKVAKLLKEDWDLTTKGVKGHEQKKFWCEKGRYRP